MKSYTNPPPLVATVLSACALLLGHKESWEDAKKNVLNDQLLNRLIEFDASTVAEKVFVKLRNTYMKDENFNKDAVMKVSEACATLYEWIAATDSFQKVKKEVIPKEKRLAEA